MTCSLYFLADEALARRLQEEEESKVRGNPGLKRLSKLRHSTEPSPLATLAAENFRTHHNSSPPQVGASDDISGSPQTGGGLLDIMGEQMAQQVQENQLVRMFPCKCKLSFGGWEGGGLKPAWKGSCDHTSFV